MFISRKFIPSLFTILNAFCGFMSIINSARGDYTDAALFIIYSLLFDAVDGLAARLTKSSSEFGVELDSLSDVISFGVAPSFLLYGIFLQQFGDFGIVLAAFMMVFAALRLARFNVQLVGYDKNSFNGLPAPMASMTICTFILFYYNKILSEPVSQTVLVVLAIALPVLMVSKIRYESLPKPSLQSIKDNPVVFVILFIAVVITIATNGEGSFSFCLFYIFTGIIRGLKNVIFKKQRLLKENVTGEPLELKD